MDILRCGILLHKAPFKYENRPVKASHNVFQKLINQVCQGTTVTPRELIGVLTVEDIASINAEELLPDDLSEIVRDLEDSKLNDPVYRIHGNRSETPVYYEE